MQTERGLNETARKNDNKKLNMKTLIDAVETVLGKGFEVVASGQINTPENKAKLKALVNGQIMVRADDWHKYLALKAERNSIDKEINRLEESMDLPEACDIGKQACLSIVNGNGDEIGKYTVYWFNGCQMPSQWRKRVS